jgi:hypothetical protein
VLLDALQSLGLWKGPWQGAERVFLTSAGLALDGEALRITASGGERPSVAIYPAPPLVSLNGQELAGQADGIFQRFALAGQGAGVRAIAFESERPAGPPRVIPLGATKPPVAVAPEDADFAQAAVWRLKLPGDLDLTNDPLLRLHYQGDVARVTLDGRLLTDNFYSGRVFEVGLRRFGPEILKGELRLAILPLGKDAPIMLAPEARPDFGSSQGVATLDKVEVIERPTLTLRGSDAPR